MRQTIWEEVQRDIVTCDVCGSVSWPQYVCRGCRRDVCANCVTVHCDIFKLEPGGPDWLCVDCNLRYVDGEFRERAEHIRDMHEAQRDALEAEFMDVCRSSEEKQRA